MFPAAASAKIESRVIATIPLEQPPRDMALSRDGATAYILCDRQILVYTPATGTIVDRIPLAGSFTRLALAPDEETMYLTAADTNEVAVLGISRVYDIPVAASPVIGPADAPVTLVAFLDIQCPYCARIYPDLEKLLARYPRDLRLVIKHFPLRMHAFAEQAAIASLAAARQDKYRELIGLLFQHFKTLNQETLAGHAARAGLDLPAFEAAMQDPRLKKNVQHDLQLGRQLNVRGVPALFINGRSITNRSVDAMAAMVDAALVTP
jgi:protein-disulfide isomerase